jgi:hypothetical protein
LISKFPVHLSASFAAVFAPLCSPVANWFGCDVRRERQVFCFYIELINLGSLVGHDKYFAEAGKFAYDFLRAAVALVYESYL